VTERGPTFVRRKFTITEALDQTLEEMATRHYQGNVSLCLRAAIESHRESLEGEGDRELAAHQIKRQLGELEQQVQELQTELNEIPIETTGDDNTGESRSVWLDVGMTTEMRAVVQTLGEASSPLRLEDLLEQTELSPRQLQSDLSNLIDQGLVSKTLDERQRFVLTGDINSAREKERGR